MLKKQHIEYQEFVNVNDLEASDVELFEEAKNAAKGSFSPYSQFKVGAALRLENGEIYAANNQENKAFPSSMCAERVLLYFVSSLNLDQEIVSLAVFGEGEFVEENDFVMPCGACLQVLCDVAARQEKSLRVITGNAQGNVRVFDSCFDLMPFSFSNPSV